MARPKGRKTETLRVSDASMNVSDVVTRPLRGGERVIEMKTGAPVGAQAGFPVTGDTGLLSTGHGRTVPIVTAGWFLRESELLT